MAIYRIVKLDKYDHVVYRVEKRVLIVFWRTMSRDDQYDGIPFRTKEFTTQREAEKWVAAQGFINTEVVVKEIRI